MTCPGSMLTCPVSERTDRPAANPPTGDPIKPVVNTIKRGSGIISIRLRT